MPSTGVYSGIAQGLQEVGQYQRERPIREARLAEANLRRRQSEIALEEYVANTENRQTMADIEVAKLKNELFNLQTESLRNATFSAFKSYNSDQDPRHLNAFLQRAKASPAGGMWQKWARFDKLQDVPDVRAQLAQAGYQPERINDIIVGGSDREMPAFVLATDTEGNQQVLDMDVLQQATGYTRYMGQQELEDSMLRAQIAQLSRGQTNADTMAISRIQEEEGISYKEAAQVYFDMKNSQRRTGSTIEREADRLQQDNPAMGRTEALQRAKVTLEGRTSVQKDIETTAAVRDRLNALNPLKEGDFYDLDLRDPKVRARAGELITDLEKATGKQLSGEEKRVARQLRSLLDLGNTAGQELTADETGILDNMFHQVRKYFSDNIEGIEGTTTYHAFRNVMRNALMGATLTNAEIKAFDQAAGTLGQQLGPVLKALQTSMTDVRNQLKSMSNDMDPMMAKYYLGTDLDQAERAIDAIDERLRHMTELQERSERAEGLTVKDLKKQQTVAPPVRVNIPSPATPDGTRPSKSIEEFWAERKGS